MRVSKFVNFEELHDLQCFAKRFAHSLRFEFVQKMFKPDSFHIAYMIDVEHQNKIQDELNAQAN